MSFFFQDRITLADGVLKKFLDSTASSSPEERAAKLEADEDICKVHDKVAKEGQTAVSEKLQCPYSLQALLIN